MTKVKCDSFEVPWVIIKNVLKMNRGIRRMVQLSYLYILYLSNTQSSVLIFEYYTFISIIEINEYF